MDNLFSPSREEYQAQDLRWFMGQAQEFECII